MRDSRVFVNLVGFMLFVQVILGSSATLVNFTVDYHIYWSVATFAVLIIATVHLHNCFGSKKI